VEPPRNAVHHHPKLWFRAVSAADDPKGFENECVFQHLELWNGEGLAFVSHDVSHVTLCESVGLSFVQARLVIVAALDETARVGPIPKRLLAMSDFALSPEAEQIESVLGHRREEP